VNFWSALTCQRFGSGDLSLEAGNLRLLTGRDKSRPMKAVTSYRTLKKERPLIKLDLDAPRVFQPNRAGSPLRH
jgi:hypothetical protein